MWRAIREVYLYREMLRNLVSKELRARYKGSILGFLWTLLNPLLMLTVYTIVFSFLMRTPVENYAMFLFVGLLPWNYLSNSIIQGTGSLVHNASLIKKVYFPREVLPLSVVLANLVNYLLSLLVLIPALLIFKIKLTYALLAFPVILVIQTILVVAITFIVAIGNVYFRDLGHITGVMLTVWFFLSPILYSPEMIPENARGFLFLNPATPLIESYRDIFFYGRWPRWDLLGCIALVSIIFLLISLHIFDHLQRRVAEEI